MKPRLLLAAAACAAYVAAAPAAEPRFFNDDPLARTPESQDASRVQPWDLSLTYDSLLNLFGHPGEPPGLRANDVNSIDEAPDSSWFTNRLGVERYTADDMRRGVSDDTGPAAGKWTVRSGKGNGVSPGFTITDTRGRRYFVKFDPPGWDELATGAEVAVTRFYHAIGYWVPQTNIAYIRREDLVLGEGATTTGANGRKRPMRASDIDSNLARAAREPDGRYRTLVSTALEGKPLGGFKYAGTRPDDPNDIVPHERMRVLRGLRVFGAWVGHTDAKAINSLDTLIAANGRATVRHNLLDFGSTLGSGGVGTKDPWEEHEYLVEIPPALRALPLLGFAPRHWMFIRYPEFDRIGRFEADHFDSDEWRPRIPNAAFVRARADDLFWGARVLSRMTDELIRAGIEAGRFSDERAAQDLVRILIERRNRILHAWLPAVNPVVDPQLGEGGELRFRNAAVDAGVAEAPAEYHAVWSEFDNATGQTRAIGESSGRDAIKAPAGLPDRAGSYVQVDISAPQASHKSWATPVHAWFRRTGGGWKLVGFERLP
jgi:hypothetical protein